jgi:HK97 family phage portal protein
MQTGIFSELIKHENGRIAGETRTSLENPSTPLSYPAEWLLDIFNGGRTDAGIRVSEMTALQVVTVFSCVDLIASALASLPLNVYERILIGPQKLPGKVLAIESDLFDLLHDEPNPEMTSFTWRKTAQCHALLWGNSYGEIQRDAGNRPVAIWPRGPHNTRPRRNTISGEMFYTTTDGVEDDEGRISYGTERIIKSADMIHIPGLSLDGRLGQDVVNLGREAIGLSLALEKFAGKFFGNGAILGGVLEYPAAMKPEAKENLKRSWKESQGGENMHSWAVLEAGVKATPLGTKPNEAQMLESRTYAVGEVARLFHVPPHMVGLSEKQNRANAEQMGLEFVNYCLEPWLACWQQELRRKLFPPRTVGRNAGKRMIVILETRKLMLPDADARQKYYAGGRQWGWLTENAVREMEDMNPSDNPYANEVWMPVNMILASQARAQLGAQPGEEQPGPGGAKEPAGETKPEDVGAEEENSNPYVNAYYRLFRDAFGRASVRDKDDFKGFCKVFQPILFGIVDLVLMNSRPEFRPGGQLPVGMVAFVRDYLGAMHARAQVWDAVGSEAQAQFEFKQAQGEIRRFAQNDSAVIREA